MRVSGKRVALQPFAGEDLPVLLEEAPTMRGGGKTLVIRRMDDPTAIGAVRYLAPHPKIGWLTIDFIELIPQLRGWGYGAEAVRLLEAESTRLGLAQHFRADVPLGNGLAAYFWLRMGYRPASLAEGFWRSDEGGDTMTMIRTPR